MNEIQASTVAPNLTRHYAKDEYDIFRRMMYSSIIIT